MSKRSFLRVLYAFDFQGDCWVLLGIVGLLGWEMCRLLLLRLAARSKCGISSANRRHRHIQFQSIGPERKPAMK